MQAILAIMKTSISLAFLIYASYSDSRTREVSNTVWILFAPPALTLTLIELFLYEPTNMLSYALSFGLTAAFALTLFYSGGFGGADAKAMMCVALALPFYPKELLMPLSGEISPISNAFFPITVFGNSVLFAALTAAYMLIRNIIWHKKNHRKLFESDQKKESLGKKILVLITGYKIPITKLKDKWHIYPLEDVEDIDASFRRKLVIIPRDEKRSEIVDRLSKAVEARKIEDYVWTTPGLPMLVFVTLGLIIALFFGDVVWAFVRFLLR